MVINLMITIASFIDTLVSNFTQWKVMVVLRPPIMIDELMIGSAKRENWMHNKKLILKEQNYSAFQNQGGSLEDKLKLYYQMICPSEMRVLFIKSCDKFNW